jgi:hypothetical protein
MTSLTDEECSICFEKLENEIAHLSCNHFFHYECIGSWIQKKSDINSYDILCPMCNQDFEILNIYLPKEQHMSQNIKQNNQNIINENIKISKSKCNIL